MDTRHELAEVAAVLNNHLTVVQNDAAPAAKQTGSSVK